jgi:hypothetical protein
MKFPCRKLFLILACLGFHSHIYELNLFSADSSILAVADLTMDRNQTNSNIPIKEKVHNKSIWLLEEASGLCLGPHGFSVCGDLTVWVWKNSAGGTLLQHSSATDDNKCLGRSWPSSQIDIYDCSIAEKKIARKGLHWEYDWELGQLKTVNSFRFNILPGYPYCINNREETQLSSCKGGFTKLIVIDATSTSFHVHDDDDDVQQEKTKVITPLSSSVAPTRLIDQGFWHCPITGLALPRNLDSYLFNNSSQSSSPLENNPHRQVFMGAGVYTKKVFGMTFNVYTVGWYVDVAALQSDSRFASFAGYSYEQFVQSNEFSNLMAQSGGFDRSLFIKLAMNLKKDVVIQGLVEDLELKPANGVSIMFLFAKNINFN